MGSRGCSGIPDIMISFISSQARMEHSGSRRSGPRVYSTSIAASDLPSDGAVAGEVARSRRLEGAASFDDGIIEAGDDAGSPREMRTTPHTRTELRQMGTTRPRSLFAQMME